MRTTSLSLLIVLSTAAALAQTGVLIPAPHIHDLVAPDRSEHRLFVSLPAAYESQPDRHFPVLYLLDGNTMFAMVAQTYGYFDTFGGLEALIIVGIGYPAEDWTEVLRRRTHDYTPTRSVEVETWLGEAFAIEDARTGGADAYLRFLRDGIIPLIESRYRTNDRRVLGGFSYGGLFGAYTLLTQPELFSGYLLGSPSLSWDGEALFRMDLPAAGSDDGAHGIRIFLSSGELETSAAHVPRFGEFVASRGHDTADLHTAIFQAETHLSVIAATMSRGLLVLFEEP